MDIKMIVYDAIYDIMHQEAIFVEIDDETELTREIGIDSMGIVSLILLLEEKMEIELDNYLIDIRKCRRVEELVQMLIRIQDSEM